MTKVKNQNRLYFYLTTNWCVRVVNILKKIMKINFKDNTENFFK